MFRQHSKGTTTWRITLNDIMSYAIARVRLRVRATWLRSLVSSFRATRVSLNGMHIYGDTGRNTHSRLRERWVVSRKRKRERGRQRAREKESRLKKDRGKGTHTLLALCVWPCRQASQISMAQSVPRLPACAFWFSSPNDLATSEFLASGCRARATGGG